MLQENSWMIGQCNIYITDKGSCITSELLKTIFEWLKQTQNYWFHFCKHIVDLTLYHIYLNHASTQVRED